MRPPILTKYPVDDIISELKSSKEKVIWVVRFIPQLLSKDKINANAISVMKRVSLLKLEPLSADEFKKIQKHLNDLGRTDLVIMRQKTKQQNVLIFCAQDDAPETIDGIERHIYRIIPNAKLNLVPQILIEIDVVLLRKKLGRMRKIDLLVFIRLLIWL